MSDADAASVGDDYALLGEALEYTISRLADTVDLFCAEASIEEAAPVLAQVSLSKKRLAEVERELAVCVGGLMPRKWMTVGQVPLERVAGSTTTTWDVDGLLPVLLARSRDERHVDETTGEFESEGEAFLRVVADCAGIAYFRSGDKEKGTGLLGRGIDPDEWRVRTKGPYKAKVTEQ